MLRTIKVYGHLAKRTGKRVFKAVARTPAEAIKFLLCNYPSLRGVMQQGQYQVLVGSLDLEGSAGNLHLPTGSEDEIRIVPVIVGAGFWKSFGKFFLGAALVTAAVVAWSRPGTARGARGQQGGAHTGGGPADLCRHLYQRSVY